MYCILLRPRLVKCPKYSGVVIHKNSNKRCYDKDVLGHVTACLDRVHVLAIPSIHLNMRSNVRQIMNACSVSYFDISLTIYKQTVYNSMFYLGAEAFR